jgi:hypothetical protein
MAFDRLFEATVNRNADCVSFNADKKQRVRAKTLVALAN